MFEDVSMNIDVKLPGRGWSSVTAKLHETTLDFFEKKKLLRSLPITPDTIIDVCQSNVCSIKIKKKNKKFKLHTPSNADALEWLYALRTTTYIHPSVSIASFDLLAVIGRGYYGKVMLAKKINTEELFAIKTIQKKKLVDRNKVATVISERNVLIQTNHPFIVKLRYAFQNPSKFYLVIEYAPGGELFFHMQKRDMIPKDEAKLYCAEIALALDYLHSKNIVYRDLKPENILLDAKGHIKLTDFGLAKDLVLNKSTSTLCGTHEYLAPELILKRPYSFEVDWWALGIILYEMLFGYGPFYIENMNEMFRRVIEEPVNFPSHTDRKIRTIIMGLLSKDPEKRYGFKQIKKHPFFSDVNWENVYKMKIKPKFVPSLQNETSLGNFDSQFTKEIVGDSIVTPALGSVQNILDFSFETSSLIPPIDVPLDDI